MGRRKKVWPKAQVAILHECWKTAQNRKQCLELIAQKLPELPPPVAWSIIRKLSRSDPNWQATAKQKERKKEEDRLKEERFRQERLKRRDERKLIQKKKEQRKTLQACLEDFHAKALTKEIGTDFFFCPDVRQFVCYLSCIYRVFAKGDKYGFESSGPCEKCDRMDEYVPIIDKIVRSHEK